MFKLLLTERVSIRNLSLILEAVAEIAPHIRRPEQIVEHVRVRISAQICGSMLDQGGALKVLRLGNRWDLVFHQSLKRDQKGEVAEFDIDPRLMEEFATQASAAIRKRLEEKHIFALVTTAETRPFVRMIIERMFPTLPVLSQLGNRARHRGAVAGRGFVSPRQTFHASTLIFTVFLLFCRIGGAMMIAPGLGNTQIPMQVRVFVAIGVTLALSADADCPKSFRGSRMASAWPG